MDRRPLRCARIALVAIAMTVGVAQASRADDGGVAKATAQFYIALNAMFAGDVAPMEAVWSHAADVTYLPPDGSLLVGWHDVSASWRKQASMKLGGHVAPEDIRMTTGGDLAVVCNFEKGANANVGGKEQTVAIRSSKVFRKENGAWKLISDHADPLLLQK